MNQDDFHAKVSTYFMDRYGFQVILDEGFHLRKVVDGCFEELDSYGTLSEKEIIEYIAMTLYFFVDATGTHAVEDITDAHSGT